MSHIYECGLGAQSLAIELEAPVIPWKNAVRSFGALAVGDIIGGFEKPPELDLFVTALCGWMGDRVFVGVHPAPEANYRVVRSGRSLLPGWPATGRMPSQVMLPAKQPGTLINIQVLPLEEPAAAKGLAERFEPTSIGLALLADYFINGKGVIGKTAQLATVGTDKYGKITAAYNKMPADTIGSAVELLAEETRQARALVVRAMRGALRAGLPGQGKR